VKIISMIGIYYAEPSK